MFVPVPVFAGEMTQRELMATFVLGHKTFRDEMTAELSDWLGAAVAPPPVVWVGHNSDVCDTPKMYQVCLALFCVVVSITFHYVSITY